MKQYIRLIIALSVLLGIAGIFILYLAWPQLTGQSIVLATRPVDPFDVLRGQYIIINYEISNIQKLEGIQEGDAVYIALKEDENKIWRYREATLTKPSQGIFIKGNVKSVYGDSMRIEYGIEQFFFERNADLPTTNMTVEVKVSSSGQARIIRLLHNGKPMEIKYQEPSLTS